MKGIQRGHKDSFDQDAINFVNAQISFTQSLRQTINEVGSVTLTKEEHAEILDHLATSLIAARLMMKSINCGRPLR